MGIERMAEVARAIDAPVMADESAWNSHDVIQIIEQPRRADRLDLHHQAGRALRAMEVAAVCARGRHRLQRQRLGRDRRRQSRQSCAGGGGAGGHARLRGAGLDACRPRSAARSAASTTSDDLIAAPMESRRRRVRVPTGPGIGIDVDHAKIEQYRVQGSERNAPGDHRAPAQDHGRQRSRRDGRRVSPENFAYAAASSCPRSRCLRQRHAIVMVKADGTHAVVTVDMEETTVRNRLPGEAIADLGRIHRQRDGLPGKAADPTWGLPRRASASSSTICRLATSRLCNARCRARRSAPPSSIYARCARSRRPKRSRCCAGCRASPTRRSPMRSRP